MKPNMRQRIIRRHNLNKVLTNISFSTKTEYQYINYNINFFLLCCFFTSFILAKLEFNVLSLFQSSFLLYCSCFVCFVRLGSLVLAARRLLFSFLSSSFLAIISSFFLYKFIVRRSIFAQPLHRINFVLITFSGWLLLVYFYFLFFIFPHFKSY